MCKLFDEWTPQIKDYCAYNNLSFEKAASMSQCWSKDDVILQYYDKTNGRRDLLNDVPMPIVLKIERTPGGLQFTQTEHTQKYLSV